MSSLNVKHQGKAPTNWHLTCQLTWIYKHSDISEAYKVQVDCLEDLVSDYYDKNDIKKKANDLVRFYEAVQEKLKIAWYQEQIQILTLVPDKWSRMYFSQYFNVFEYLVWTSHEVKKSRWNIRKTCSQNRKNYHQRHP